MVNAEIRLITFFAAKDGEALSIQSAKTRPGADCGSDHELLIAKLPGISSHPTFAFQSPMMKRASFWGVSFRRSYQFSSVQLLSRVRLFATP